MKNYLKKIHNNIEIIYILAITDFKLRYYGSFFGYIWALLKPLLIFLVIYTVFSIFMNLDIKNYQLFLLLGIIIWNFFSESTMLGTTCIQNKANIVKKIKFQTINIPIASTISSIIGLFFNMIVFYLIAYFNQVYINSNIILIFFIFICLFLIILGINMFLCVIYIYFKDTNQIWEVLLQIGFWITPILYSEKIIPSNFAFLKLNPIFWIIKYTRNITIYNITPNIIDLLYLLLISIIIFLLGYIFFNNYSKYINEKL